MGKRTFHKNERLTRESWIRELFERGSTFHLHPFRVTFMPHPKADAATTQVLISVSSKNFKRAVDRNTLKRRMREGYRLNKPQPPDGCKWLIAYIYTAKEILPSEIIHQRLALSFQRFQPKEYEKKN